jgi:hypothetical protein
MDREHAETHHLNPVSIRVQDESNTLNLPIGEALFEWNAQPLETCASGLNVVHGDRDVAESLRFGIARMVGCLVERLCAVIVGKFEDA